MNILWMSSKHYAMLPIKIKQNDSRILRSKIAIWRYRILRSEHHDSTYSCVGVTTFHKSFQHSSELRIPCTEENPPQLKFIPMFSIRDLSTWISSHWALAGSIEVIHFVLLVFSALWFVMGSHSHRHFLRHLYSCCSLLQSSASFPILSLSLSLSLVLFLWFTSNQKLYALQNCVSQAYEIRIQFRSLVL